MKKKESFRPDHVAAYFRLEWFVLLLITFSGLIYNFGLLAGPWFEGKLAECLLNVLQGTADFPAMLKLVLAYVLAIAVVQLARYIKRFYVRRFANNVNRRMKRVLYASLIRRSHTQLEQEGSGSLITKAISDVDDCVEGMRKFTTEIFDTGVAMACYIGMLLVYDWRLALLCCIFPPISYVLAERMKRVVQRTGAAFKQQNGALSAATLDRVTNAVTYRVYGCEDQRSEAYEQKLTAYERAAVRASIWGTAMPPLYQIISMASVLFILYFGGRNVTGSGWTAWDIAAFTTFVACYAKLAVKSSKAAKLFNAVHRAQVSWGRIRPFMEQETDDLPDRQLPAQTLEVSRLGFAWPGAEKLFHAVSFTAEPGQIIGITGPVACGKSTLGRTFLCEAPYEGSIRFGGAELSGLSEADRRGALGYLGHDPELQNDTIEHNLCMGDSLNAESYLRLVCLSDEVKEMEQGTRTMVGSSGVRLSGGQAQRLALARTLAHRKPLMILDDPFSALDQTTEQQVFRNLKETMQDSIVLLISHRLYLFPQLDQVLWMDGQTVTAGTHASLMETCPDYAARYRKQKGEDSHEE